MPVPNLRDSGNTEPAVPTGEPAEHPGAGGVGGDLLEFRFAVEHEQADAGFVGLC